MFNSRRSIIDPDIDIGGIKSAILERLLGWYDSVVDKEDQREIFFVDPYKRFFFSMLDRISWFTLDNPPEDYIGATSVCVPVVRAIYVAKHHRGKGLQRKILDDVIALSEELGNSFGIFADPFEINNKNGDNISNIGNALAAFLQFGYEPTENYLFDLAKQRERFLSLGIKNCKFADAELTQEFQHFLYVPTTAPDEVKMLQNQLELDYQVNWAFFNKDGN